MNYICQDVSPENSENISNQELIDFYDKHYEKECYIEFSTGIYLAAKRGNKAHDQRVQNRVYKIKKRFEQIAEIDPVNCLSNSIHLVLTYPEGCQSWENFRADFSRFIDSMRKDKAIGLTDYIITIESTKKGVAHAHVLLTLQDSFKYVISHRYNPLVKKRFKHGLICNPDIVKRIKDRWGYITGIDACYSKGAANYIFKYVTKELSGVKAAYKRLKDTGYCTDAERKKLLSVFHLVSANKRSFSVSRTYSAGRGRGAAVDLGAADCENGGECMLCENKCFKSLVILKAQSRIFLKGFWSFKNLTAFFPDLKYGETVKEAIIQSGFYVPGGYIIKSCEVYKQNDKK
jgi:hypothetical protein